MKTNSILLLFFLMVFIIPNTKSQETCITNAWKEYNSGNYKNAIKYADQCIDDFGKKALKIQHKLDSLKITPEIGAVNDIKKNKIFENGLLNDVSAACFVKGRSAEQIYKQDKMKNKGYKQIAIDAYKLACKYSKGRCWDPKGWFWSPCEGASERLPLE